MKSFSAKIFKIGINPYVLLPAEILKYLFVQAGKDKGHIPINVIINDQNFIQTLVKYSSKWRLYLNTPMRKVAGKDVSDVINVQIEYDEEKRITPLHPKLEAALKRNRKAKDCFDSLPPSRQKEISRYLHNLKTEEAINRNIERAIDFLTGRQRLIGRDKPL